MIVIPETIANVRPCAAAHTTAVTRRLAYLFSIADCRWAGSHCDRAVHGRLSLDLFFSSLKCDGSDGRIMGVQRFFRSRRASFVDRPRRYVHTGFAKKWPSEGGRRVLDSSIVSMNASRETGYVAT